MARITADLTDGFQVEISNGRHVWPADEPEDDGGSDTGPNPYELLLGALAACTCITISYYCRHKDLPLASVSARFEFDRVHADDCEDCDDADSDFLHRITSEIFIEGDFDDDVKERLKQVAVRCPVHKTLEAGLQFAEEVFVD